MGPAGPANCSFLLAAQFSCQIFRQNFPRSSTTSASIPLLPNSIPPWLLTLLGLGMRHLTGAPLIGLRWIIVHLWPDEMGLSPLHHSPDCRLHFSHLRLLHLRNRLIDLAYLEHMWHGEPLSAEFCHICSMKPMSVLI